MREHNQQNDSSNNKQKKNVNPQKTGEDHWIRDPDLYPAKDSRMRKEQDYSDDIGVYDEGYSDNIPRNATHDHGSPRPHHGYDQDRVEQYNHTQDREASRYSNQGRFGSMGSDPVKNSDDADIHKEARDRNADGESGLTNLPSRSTRH